MSASSPLVTFFLFAYNQEAYVREACEAALAQTYTPLEIIFSDDHSSDATFAIMQAVAADYTGPHTVKLNRNPQNIGLIGHVNLSASLASGELLIAAAGDDISLPHRTATLVNAYLADQGRSFSIHSSALMMDVEGNSLELLRPKLIHDIPPLTTLADMMPLIIGATHAWSRQTFTTFGPISFSHAYEDLVIAFRSALLGNVRYIDEALVKYRVGNGMSTVDWAKLPDRKARQRRAVKNLHTEVAVLEQRRADSLVLQQAAIAKVIDLALQRRHITLTVYEGITPAHRILVRALRQGLLRVAIKAYIRLARGRA